MHKILFIIAISILLLACNTKPEQEKHTISSLNIEDAREEKSELVVSHVMLDQDLIMIDSLRKLYEEANWPPQTFDSLFRASDGEEYGLHAEYYPIFDFKVPDKTVEISDDPAYRLSNLTYKLVIQHYDGESGDSIEPDLIEKTDFSEFISEEYLSYGLMQKPELLSFDESEKTFSFKTEIVIPFKEQSEEVFFQLDSRGKITKHHHIH